MPADQDVVCQEAFGPVAVLSRFRDFDAALAQVNDSVFGLQAGVFTRDLYKAQRAWDELEVGGVVIGDVPSWRVDHMPYGGVKESGLGREGVRFAIEEMTEIRLLIVRTPPMNASIREILAGGAPGASVRVQGWLRTARHGKEVSFLELNDGSCLAGLQLVAAPELPNYESEVKRLRTGCAVEATGTLVESPGQRAALRAARARRSSCVGEVGDDYPLQKKRHGFEFLRTIAHLRPRTNTLGAVLRVRSAAARAIHEFFQQRGFVLLHAPIITASDAEGAGQLFRVTTLDPDAPPRDEAGRVDFAHDFFGRETFLTVSGQLEAEIAALALTQRLHLRPHLPRRELEHQPPPGRVLDGRARDGLLRPRGRHAARRGLPEVAVPRRARGAAPRTWPSSTSASTTACSRRCDT